MHDLAPATNLGMDWAVGLQRVQYDLSRLPVHGDVVTDAETTDVVMDYHAALELGIVLSGRQERLWEGFACEVGPGDVWVANMWEPHGYRALVRRTTIVVLQFTPAFLQDATLGNLSWLTVFASPAHKRPRLSTEKQRTRLRTLGEWMREEIEKRPPQWLAALQLCVANVLLELSREWHPPRPLSSRKGMPYASLSRIIPALDLLREQGPSRVGVREACQACRVSRATLNRLCREVMGISFAKLRMRAHVAYAAHRLLTTDLPTDEIALEAGFSDASHFHRSFVKLYGQTPGQFRAKGWLARR
jgi:AraC-like DNA-binding protein